MRFYLFILLTSSFPAWGQLPEDREKNLYLPQDTFHSKVIEENNNIYASATLGNGVAHGANIIGEKSMQWRTVEYRFGKEINIPAFISEKAFLKDAKFRFDSIYYNEGHPDNNHRDGFGVQIVYKKPLNQQVNLELGVGPYFSMNTTTIKGVELNDTKLGGLLSIAALVDLGRFSPGLHMRYALNHVTMPGAHSSDALLVGVGKYFDQTPASAQSESSWAPVWIGASAGMSQTNHKDAEYSPGFSVEAKKYYDYWGASIAGIIEGNDDTRVNRKGVAIQGWFIQSLNENWAISTGIGPYLATNIQGSNNFQVHGLITLQVERFISKKWKGLVSFSRIATFTENIDRDLFRVGVMRQFGK